MAQHSNNEELIRLFDSFQNRKVLVIGDVMLDAYWWGKVDRISPEAPVPIANISKREFRLGGAANVALNLKKLGAEPTLCSVVGEDMEAEVFLRKAEEAGVSTGGIIYVQDRPTTVKTRVIGNKSQLLRIDTESDHALSTEDSERLANRVLRLMDKAEIIIFEDYDKGAITRDLINKVTEEANSKKIPIVVDPKKRNFLSYEHATLFKPNLRELAEGLKIDIDGTTSIEHIRDAAQALIQRLHIQYAMITLSERGMLICNEREWIHVPAHIRSISDVSGAGDTVISVAALALLSGADMRTIASLANLAGGLVCEKAGVVPIEANELMQEAMNELSF